VVKLLDVTKNGFLGVYFFLEMATIVSSLFPLNPHLPISPSAPHAYFNGTHSELLCWFGFWADFIFFKTNVMGITATTWGPQIAQESAKFWFYAIATSILLSLYQVFFVVTPTRTAEKVVSQTTDEKSTAPLAEKTPQANSRSTEIYRQLLIDGCDLFVPGSVVGWLPTEPLTVGIFMSISSILAMSSMWPKIQANAAAAAKKK
jgi:hypothetical protein